MILSSVFWKHFAKTYWEKKPVAFRNVSSPLLEMDEAEIFRLLVEYANRCRKLKSPDGFKFYVSGHRQFESEALRRLPKKSDKSLQGYHERMAELFSDYCLVCDELLQVNHAQHEKLAAFTASLYKEVGLPNRFSEMGLYLGNYRKTPFGVHVDGCGVFSFPVVGEKSFRIWRPEYVRKNPKLKRAFRYSKFKNASTLLNARVGDMTYWPSSAWHIAESNGKFSATWSLGVWIDQAHGDDVTKIVSGLLRDESPKRFATGLTPYDSLCATDGEIRELPALYKESITDLKRIITTRTESAFLKAWLIHTSMEGFKTNPRRPVSLREGATIRLATASFPVRWIYEKTEKRFYYCFNGVLTEASASKTLLKLVKDLNAGKTVRVTSQTRASLQTLASAGAFRLV